MTFIFPIEKSDQRSLVGCAVVFSIIPTVAVSLRILARRISNRKTDTSEFLVITALINVVGYHGLNIACVLVGGAGWHLREILERFEVESGSMTFLKLLCSDWRIGSADDGCSAIHRATSLALTKLAILSLYCNIFTVRRFVVIAYTTAIIILLWMIAVIVGGFLICQPVAFNWDPDTPGGHCGNPITLWLCTGIPILLPIWLFCYCQCLIYTDWN
ncbi:uncharacterized protein BCR38DRAFT_515892 [Pseudomassariella vexata]|uniref:Rhodopsin domain-containing protein n=1 Tax=Pseudomassariella vexata TaxID=1141098 RepID=A0A1Y2DUP4_9PEZI|nr:uncharacterized protein BCR38DRAFT_515892 [Pseudomassariella vexata]ORY62978.1 hypothetical protein BCR38DRAFT_515892 [Pseudomassariella vexata]